MKKSVISLMLVLAFLLSALSPSAWAASSPQAEYYAADNTSENPTDTGKFVEMWSKAATSGGTVKLLQDVTMPTAQWGVGFYEQYGTVFVPSGKTITLDLNDCTLDRGLTTSKTSGGVIRVEGILTLKDGSSNKGGTITGGYSSSGGGIYIKDGTLNMQGGKIPNNHATGDGGGVCVATGTFNLSGGEISGNTSSGTTGGSGGIYNYQGIVNMTGGTITNNTSSYHGGGIHNCKTLSISGGLIQDNTTTHYGGGVFFAGGSCNISGTPQITNNSNKDGTNNVQSYSSTPQISQLREGASIGFSRRPASDSDPISIARTADRNGETYLKYFFADDSENYHIVWNETYYQFQLASGPVPHTHYLNVNCQANTEGVVGYSPTTFEHRLSTDENGALLVDGQKKSTGSHSLSYPAFGVVGYELEPGSYYLESDCMLDHPIIFCTNGEMLNLCLNGHTIFPKDPGSIRGSLIYACKTGSGASDSVGFNLCDCSTGETGAVTGGNANGSGELNNGGGIYVHAGETGFFRMFSGNITGNKAAGNGGGIYSVRARNSNGSTVIYGGTVSGNTAGGNGGGIYSCLDDKFELKGGIISRNEATGQNGNGDGGGIYSLGLFYMYDGEVSGNTAAGTGGGLFLNGQNYSDIQEHIWAGEIKNNTAQTGGGIALTNRKLDITTGSVGTGKCKITGNNASDSGAGISVDTTSKLQLNGTGMEISGNKLTGTGSGFGAGVDVQGTISLSGTPVVYNNTDAQNAQNNLYLRSDKTVDFVSSLSSGAKIGITKPMPEDGTTYVQISSIRANSSYAGYFTADNPAYEVIWTEAYKYLILALKGTAPHIHALNVGCQAAKDAGVGGETVTFSRLTSNNRNQLQADNITVSNNTLTTGNYYVASDLTLATEIKITGDVNLCLNGHVITSAPRACLKK